MVRQEQVTPDKKRASEGSEYPVMEAKTRLSIALFLLALSAVGLIFIFIYCFE